MRDRFGSGLGGSQRGFPPPTERYYYLILYNDTGASFRKVAENISSQKEFAWEDVLKNHLGDTQSPGGVYLVYNTSTGEGHLMEAVRNEYDVTAKVIS